MREGLRVRSIVTGGAGFIGSHLVDALINRGDEVMVIDNLSTGKIENIDPRAKLIQWDIRYINFHHVTPIFKSADYVFHLAALPKVQYSLDHPEETNAVNINGTLNIIALAADLNVERLIYSSSSSVYGNQAVLPLKEDIPVNPLSPYALQKFVGEKYCQMLCDPSKPDSLKSAVCLRYFNVYGSRQSDGNAYPSAIGIFMKNKKAGTTSVIYGGKQTRDFTWVGDVVRANILAAESDKVGKGEVINIGGGKSYSVLQLAEMIGGSYVHKPQKTGEPMNTLADISKARDLLGWEPTVTLEEGIAKLKELNGLM